MRQSPLYFNSFVRYAPSINRLLTAPALATRTLTVHNNALPDGGAAAPGIALTVRPATLTDNSSTPSSFSSV